MIRLPSLPSSPSHTTAALPYLTPTPSTDPREEEEVKLLKDYLPQLLDERLFESSRQVILSFLTRFPTRTDVYLLLAELYQEQAQCREVVDCCWAALYTLPGTRQIVRLLRTAEEDALVRDVDLPHSIKALMFEHEAEEEDTEEEEDEEDGVELLRYDDVPPFPVLTRKPLPPGSLLLRQRPVAIAPFFTFEGMVTPHCFHCLKHIPSSLSAGVHEPSRMHSCPSSPHTCPFGFCSYSCMLANAKVHNMECQALPMVLALAKRTGLQPMFVLLLVRVLLRVGIDRHSGGPCDKLFPSFFDIHPFAPLLKKELPEVFAALELLAELVEEVFPVSVRLHLQREEMFLLLVSLHTHALPVHYQSPPELLHETPPFSSIGLAFSPSFMPFSHSCLPSTVYTYSSSGLLSLHTICDAPENAILSFNCVPDPALPPSLARCTFPSARLYCCSCERCSDPAEGFMRGHRCRCCVRGFRTPVIRGEVEAGGDSEEKRLKERWVCSSCTSLDDTEMDLSQKMEDELLFLYKNALKCFQGKKGEHGVEGTGQLHNGFLSGRRLLEQIVSLYSPSLHVNHFVLFNCHAHLARLHYQNPGQNIQLSLQSFRRATIAAEVLLPLAHPEKTTLLLGLSTCSLAASLQAKHIERGHGLNPRLLLEPLFRALWNASLCWGRRSVERLVALRRLRRVAAALDVFTPPSKQTVVPVNTDQLFKFWRVVEPSKDTNELLQLLAEDPSRGAFLAAQLHGTTPPTGADAIWHCFRTIRNLGTGLTLFGTAMANANLTAVKAMLAADFDYHGRNEWGVTPLIALAASPSLSGEDSEAEILRCIIRRIRNLAAASFPLPPQDRSSASFRVRGKLAVCRLDKETTERLVWQLKRELFESRTHWLIGAHTALHYAAARGKHILVRQVLRSGSVVNPLNSEGSSPLLLAALSGNTDVTRELLSAGANPNQTNNRGETPLLIAAHHLQPETLRLLLDAGSSIDARAAFDCVNVLHAVAAGVPKLFQARHTDTPAGVGVLEGLMVTGWGKQDRELETQYMSVDGYYLLGGMRAHLPAVEMAEAAPWIAVEKGRKMFASAEEIVEMVDRKVGHEEAKKMRNELNSQGFTPSGLLQHLWDRLINCHIEGMEKGSWSWALSVEEASSRLQSMRTMIHMMERLKVRLLQSDGNSES
eukprot:GHVS01009258.1.p1 GENE.GHVS01009258.1~~GHVS01009258.1.p1  ORF type:complete len:1164 (+),score=171.71 GHVS01009258.1:162-3653(+)